MRKSKKVIIASLITAMLVVPVWYINNFTVKLTEADIPCGKVQEDIKIALISDLHGANFGKDNSEIINMIRENQPDLIFILGDMYSRNQLDKIDSAVKLAESLSEISQTFVITGDHDTDEQYAKKISLLDKVELMNYQKKDFTVNETDITLYGIDNVYFTPSFDLHNSFEEPNPDRLNILLSHIPEIKCFENFGVDVIFSGDTHGGMVRLPIIGPMYYNGYLIPKLTYGDEMTDKGLYSYGNQNIFVTSGLGNYPLPLRFLNRPEVCLITLKKETAK